MVCHFKTCELCGRGIDKGRLSVLPQTRRCIICVKRVGSDINCKQIEVGMDLDTYLDLVSAIRNC